MRVSFKLRPLTLEVEHTTPSVKRSFDPPVVTSAAFALYRHVAHRVIAELVDENRRLRRGRNVSTSPLVAAVRFYVDRRWPARADRGPVLDRLAPGEGESR